MKTNSKHSITSSINKYAIYLLTFDHRVPTVVGLECFKAWVCLMALLSPSLRPSTWALRLLEKTEERKKKEEAAKPLGGMPRAVSHGR